MVIENTHTNTMSTTVHQELPTAHHAEGEEGGLLTINGTLIVIIASFIIFTVLMQLIFYGPVTKIRNKRSDYLKKMKKDAEDAALQAENLNVEYQEKLKDTRKNVSEKTVEILNEANDEKNRILEQKKQEASKFIDEESWYLYEDKDRTTNELKNQVMDYAYRISVKILGEGVPMAGISHDIVEKALCEAEGKHR